MSQVTINSGDSQPVSIFEKIKRLDKGSEWWSSRDMAQILGYAEYRGIERVLEKAKLACINSGMNVDDHFVNYNEMIEIGKGAKREIEGVMLSRYAGYLLIQNADPSKSIVAEGQTYFAIQTRKQELNDRQIEDDRRILLRKELKDHNKKLAETAKGAGVVQPIDFAIFQNHGYMGLYGGLTNQDIHKRKGLKKGQQILDHMGSTELAANLFRATQAEEKIRREKTVGKENANRAHLEVGKKVRQTIHELGGTAPENLPMADDLKKIGRKNKKSIEKK